MNDHQVFILLHSCSHFDHTQALISTARLAAMDTIKAKSQRDY